jgi:hypothetical protein
MCVLACAGVEWGVPNLVKRRPVRMRQRLDGCWPACGRSDVATATSAGADFRTIMISASGNARRTHVDLVVTRMRRLLGLAQGVTGDRGSTGTPTCWVAGTW